MFDLDFIKSQTTLAQLDFHSELGSTNDRAIELIRKRELTSPALVLTETQTAGRGQRSHKWWSGQGSLTFSFVYSAQHQPHSTVPLAVALGIAEAVEAATTLRKLQIKWPNDILVSQRKLAGILIETISQGQQTFVVVGIGINANNEAITSVDLETLDQKADHSAVPTSIQIETGRHIEPDKLLVEIINRIAVPSLSAPDLIEQVNQRLAFRNQPIQVEQSGAEGFTGLCDSVSQDGQLIVKNETGLVKLASGSIRLK